MILTCFSRSEPEIIIYNREKPRRDTLRTCADVFRGLGVENHRKNTSILLSAYGMADAQVQNALHAWHWFHLPVWPALVPLVCIGCIGLHVTGSEISLNYEFRSKIVVFEHVPHILIKYHI